MRNRFKGLLVSALISFSPQSALSAEEDYSEVLTTTQKFGDWVVRCEKTNKEENSCVMTHKIVAISTGQEVVQANIAMTPEGTLMTLIFPLGVYLPNGVGLEIVDHVKRQFDITFCMSNGCFVNEILDPELINLLRKKESAFLTVYGGADKPIEVPFSIVGFLDAYKKL